MAQFEQLVDSGRFAALPSPMKPKQLVPEEIEEEDEDSDEFLDRVYTGPPASQQALFDELMLDSRLWKLFSDIMGQGYETPEVGEDIEDKNGELIGTAELSWEAQQVAVLLEEQLNCRPALEGAGWSCFSNDELNENRSVLWDLLERGQ